MGTKTILLDADGVLVDFVRGARRFHGRSEETHPFRQTPWELEAYFGIESEAFWAPLGREFWAGLQWIDEGRELYGLLCSEFGPENVVICTSPCQTDGCIDGKLDWIKRNIPGHARRYAVTPVKDDACAGPTKILVDDSDRNVAKFIESGGKAVLVPQPWNVYRSLLNGDRYNPQLVFNRVLEATKCNES